MKLKNHEFWDEAAGDWKPMTAQICGPVMETGAKGMKMTKAIFGAETKIIYIRKKEQKK